MPHASAQELKLLYYAQGHYLASTGEPLVSDRVKAWSHGPVVPDVYHLT